MVKYCLRYNSASFHVWKVQIYITNGIITTLSAEVDSTLGLTISNRMDSVAGTVERDSRSRILVSVHCLSEYEEFLAHCSVPK